MFRLRFVLSLLLVVTATACAHNRARAPALCCQQPGPACYDIPNVTSIPDCTNSGGTEAQGSCNATTKKCEVH